MAGRRGPRARSPYRRDAVEEDGITTFRVSHTDVKEVFNEIWANDFVPLSRKHGGAYWLYELAQPQSIPTALSTVACGLGGAPVPTTILASPSTRPSTIDTGKLTDYLDNNPGCTLKQVQSRFKGVTKTCLGYADLIVSLGYALNKNNPDYASTWTVA